MRWRALVMIVVVALGAGLPVAALAADPTGTTGSEDITDVLVRTSGPLVIAAGETQRTVVVLGHDATVDGTVSESLVVVNGVVTVNGTVEGNVIVVNGTLVVNDGARIGHQATLWRSSFEQHGNVAIGDGVHHVRGISIGPAWWLIFGVGMTLIVLAGGLVFAAIGGRQLMESAALVTARPGETILGAVVVAAALPALAVLASITVIGIPLAVFVLLFVIPSVWFVGYLVAGAALGGLIVRAGTETPDRRRPFLAVTVGLVLLQMAAFIPILGGIIAIVAGTVGAGALAFRAWGTWRGQPTARPVATAAS